MRITANRLKTLEQEIISLRAAVEQLLLPKRPIASKTGKDRAKLLNLFGAWDGEIDVFLEELSARRERRGRLE